MVSNQTLLYKFPVFDGDIDGRKKSEVTERDEIEHRNESSILAHYRTSGL